MVNASSSNYNVGYDVIQLCHGRLIPSFSSGYSLRCNQLTEGMKRIMITISGPSFSNKVTEETIEFHANLLLLNALIRGNRSFEVLLSRGKYLPSGYKKKLNSLIYNSKCVILEGPWHYPLIKDIIKDKPFIYDAHNAESQLRRENKYYDFVRNLEKEVCDSAAIIITLSQEDKNYFEKEYNIPPSKVKLLTQVPAMHETRWDGQKSKTILFIGSLYEANIVAYREVEKLAVLLPDFNFVVLGSICNMLGKKRLNNLKCLGMISENEKDRIMAASMLALNPILLGSGRNVKMIDYFAHSMPVISTKLGVRGFDQDKIQKACTVVGVEDFAKTIQELDGNRELLEKMSIEAHKSYVEVKTENQVSFQEIYNNVISGKP